jgi:hypothetical protein
MNSKDPEKNNYLKLVRSDRRITTEDLRLLFEKDLEHISSYWIFAVGALVGLLAYALGNVTALGPNALSVYQGKIATIVALSTAAGIMLFLFVVDWERVSRSDFRYFIEAKAEIEFAKRSESTGQPVSHNSEESPMESKADVNHETQPTDSVELQRERLRFYWDYERSHFTQLLVLLFSVLIGAATILNAQVASPIIHLNVYYEDAVLLVVFAFVGQRLPRVIFQFRKTVFLTDGYLKDMGSLPDLRELCGVKTDPSTDWQGLESFWKREGRILIAIGVILFVYLGLWSSGLVPLP